MSDQTEVRSLPIRLRVRVDFCIAVLLAGVRDGLEGMLLWAGIIFGSLLIHEMARCLIGYAGGWRGSIAFTALGPNTRFEPEPALGPFALLRLMGPITGLVLACALAYAGHFLSHAAPIWMTMGMSFNFVWAAVNLLPIGQFDVGRVVHRWLGQSRSATALLISTMTAEMTATVTFVFFKRPELGGLILAAGIVSAVQWLKLRRRLLEDEVLASLYEAQTCLHDRRHAAAREAAAKVATSAHSSALRNEAIRVIGWAALGDGDFSCAQELLQRVGRSHVLDAYTLAAVESASGRPRGAIEALHDGRRTSGLSRDAARLLVDLYAQAGDLRGAAAAATDLSPVLGPVDVRQVAGALVDAGEFDLASVLIRTVFGTPPHELRSPSSIAAIDKRSAG